MYDVQISTDVPVILRFFSLSLLLWQFVFTKNGTQIMYCTVI